MNWQRVKHFSRAEFICHHCGQEEMQEAFVLKLDALRERLGFPLMILSGYRCPEHNRVVSDTGLGGPHTLGLAADVQCSASKAHAVLTLAMAMGFTGIGVKQKGDIGARFLHLDMVIEVAPRPNVWSY